MNIDKKILYILSVIFSGILLLCCFVPKTEHTNLLIAAFTLIAAAVFHFCVKKRSVLAVPHRQVSVIMGTCALMCITLYFLTGIGFGFYKNPTVAIYLRLYIIPYTVAICAAEYIRRILLTQKDKLVAVIGYIAFVCMDVLLFMQRNTFKSFNSFIDFLGMVVFPAITANLLYHYISSKYGFLPNILYRVLISVYGYIIPIKPKMPEAMLAFARLLLPLIIFVFIRALYVSKRKTTPKRSKALKAISATTILCLMAAFIMLISCHFRFGLLVIATESMTGTLNKGDAIIYEQYDCQKIEIGQVIVFNYNNRRTIHRVIDMEKINGELRFHTKGDANEDADSDYITTEDIIGVEVLKIKYLGYPTVWMRELF